MAVTGKGAMFSWGRGGGGALGLGVLRDRTEPVCVPCLPEVVMAACGGDHTLAVTTGGCLWASGKGACGRLGLNDEEDWRRALNGDDGGWRALDLGLRP